MKEYKQEFIEFIVQVKALQFGSFTLKSGRTSPYFFNSSLFNSGGLISRLGYFYAAAIHQEFPEATLIYGPAYKGIPLCVAAAMEFSRNFGEIGYVFNRKEAKTHGDKGLLVGQIPIPADIMVMVDDVITDGATKKEAVALLQELTPARFAGVLVSLDRRETNTEGKNTVRAFEESTGIAVRSIVNIDEVCEYLCERDIGGNVYMTRETLRQIQEYRKQFGEQ
ncbi:MAG: orotate phosphoribosyltransferase [SAR324 cluster bacterium]|nr:orotate phosphoribosyltransferase [SAR324 cluster bacterium]